MAADDATEVLYFYILEAARGQRHGGNRARDRSAGMVSRSPSPLNDPDATLQKNSTLAEDLIIKSLGMVSDNPTPS